MNRRRQSFWDCTTLTFQLNLKTLIIKVHSRYIRPLLNYPNRF
ncbi:hypothetical protein COO91_03947 [Nostoc flagelliforme CCNUN1]|uniref:Uncharacterized protein n=1 Tax=Nostoc flagelliforme CCNUN1 TaxID=2038116 RepID=A0A2K8SRQ9_9NOSO|nr:hypothetical protein COO91_03947 [Nostoc flagelliforme CCNUN1]